LADGYTRSTSLSSRAAINTTVNAAFLAGIVQTTNSFAKHYSGWRREFPAFPGELNSSTLTYRAPMVVMFPSRYATSFWIAPATYYNALRASGLCTNSSLAANFRPYTAS